MVTKRKTISDMTEKELRHVIKEEVGLLLLILFQKLLMQSKKGLNFLLQTIIAVTINKACFDFS